MDTLDAQFDGALSKVNLRDKIRRAKLAHQEVRATLEADPKLNKHGVQTILIGSYGRDVAIWPGHDVDVFVKLPGFSEGPESLYDSVRAPLKKRYGVRLDDSGRHALAISFDNDFSVDAVGATTSTSGHWKIPAPGDTGNRTRWDESDPERLGQQAEDRNKTPTVGGQGAYKPIVKLVRQVRAHHLKDERPNGLYLEMLTYWPFDQGVTGATFAELLASSLRRIAAQLQTGAIARDPALDRPYHPAPTSGQLSLAARVFGDLATQAASALTMESCPAAASWRQILGQNENGWVFPLPDGCDASGKPIKSVLSISALGSDEARGFAGP